MRAVAVQHERPLRRCVPVEAHAPHAATSRISTPAMVFETGSSRAVTCRVHPPLSRLRLRAIENGYLPRTAVSVPLSRCSTPHTALGFSASSAAFDRTAAHSALNDGASDRGVFLPAPAAPLTGAVAKPLPPTPAPLTSRKRRPCHHGSRLPHSCIFSRTSILVLHLRAHRSACVPHKLRLLRRVQHLQLGRTPDGISAYMASENAHRQPRLQPCPFHRF